MTCNLHDSNTRWYQYKQSQQHKLGLLKFPVIDMITMTESNGTHGSPLGQAQKCGRIKTVNWI